MTVELADGTRRSAERAYPRGDYRDPIPDGAFDDRLRDLLRWGLPDSRVEAAHAALGTLSERPPRETAAALAAR